MDDTPEKATLADDIRDIILDGLREPVPAIGYYFGRRLEETHPGKCVLEGVSPFFNVEAFANAGHCGLAEHAIVHGEHLVYWASSEVGSIDRLHNVLLDVSWEGRPFQILITHFQDGFGQYRYWIVAENQELAERFHVAVCEWNYPFDLPLAPERRQYVGQWNGSLKQPLRLSDAGVASVAERTGEFSFAYLKELFLSSMMAWLGNQRPMDEVMSEQVEVLRGQMESIAELPSDPGYQDDMGYPPVHQLGGLRGGPRFQPGFQPEPPL